MDVSSARGTCTIDVLNLSGALLYTELWWSNSRVIDIKETIEASFGIPLHEQHLLHDGEQLEDYNSVSDIAKNRPRVTLTLIRAKRQRSEGNETEQVGVLRTKWTMTYDAYYACRVYWDDDGVLYWDLSADQIDDEITALVTASRTGRLPIVESFIEIFGQLPAARDIPCVALNYAARFSHLSICEALLAHGADPVYVDVRGLSALHWAAPAAGPNIFQVLLSHGASVHARSLLGETPLIVAATCGNVHAIENLVARGADLEASDDSGFTPLITAAAHGQRDAVKELLSRGANLEATSRIGWTASHHALMRGHKAIATELQRSAGS